MRFWHGVVFFIFSIDIHKKYFFVIQCKLFIDNGFIGFGVGWGFWGFIVSCRKSTFCSNDIKENFAWATDQSSAINIMNAASADSIGNNFVLFFVNKFM